MGLGLPRLRKKDGEKLDKLLDEIFAGRPIIMEIGDGREHTIDAITIRVNNRPQRYTLRTPNARANIRAQIMATTPQGVDLLQSKDLTFHAGRLNFAATKIANSVPLGGQYVIGQTRTGGGGVGTEVWSEILAMYCTAYRIRNGRSITRAQFSQGGDLVPTVRSNLSSMVRVRTRLMSFSSLSDRQNLVTFGLSPLGAGGPRGSIWLDCAISQAEEIMSNINNIPATSIIFNDKFFGNGRNRWDPYKVYLKNGNRAETDKWNPADMWIMTPNGLNAMGRFNQTFGGHGVSGPPSSVFILNDFLIQQYNDGNIFPISLKKLNPQSPHFALMNSNEFVDRIDISNQRNPAIIEFTRGNRDVKINFTVETVRLRPGMTAANAQRNLMRGGRLSAGTVVPNSQKEIRIKFKTSTRGLELEYEQTGARIAQAKMGALGKNEYNRIISGTTNQGIHHLNTLKENFEGTDLVLNDSMNQFTSHDVNIKTANLNLAHQYLDLIFRDLNDGIAHDGTYLTTDTAVKDKIVAGEIGVAIDKITNASAKRRVIQHLYNACASIGIGLGLTAQEQQLTQGQSHQVGNIRADFVGGIHAKVY